MLQSTLMGKLACFSLLLLFYSCGSSPTNEQASASPADDTTTAPAMDSAALVSRGDYLVKAMGCDDCHSPKKMGARGPEMIPELRLSGWPSSRPVMKVDKANAKLGWALFAPDLTAQVGPWGMSFSANITSDATGIGNWKEEQFFTAIREGKAKGLKDGRPLAPPMPWMNYKGLTDEDLRSIFYFLRSVKAVANVVPEGIPPTKL